MPANSPYNPDADKELFVRIARGDEAAFRELFHSYTKQLLPFVQRLTGSAAEAEEVIQNLFMELWLQRSKLGAIESPKAWIIRLASNMATNYLRRQAANGKLLNRLKQSGLESYLVGSQELGAGQDLAAKEMLTIVSRAIDQLSPAVKKVYLMSREQEMTIPEIARELKTSPNTVKNQLIKALNDIRSAIQKGFSFLF
ncbi:MAG TPA: RNA polymerase sigma-70 factor [Chitinophagaceae bacterium]|nr:RNA polymerase sigma-70 factor [Chitinophagaceae bacterium]